MLTGGHKTRLANYFGYSAIPVAFFQLWLRLLRNTWNEGFEEGARDYAMALVGLEFRLGGSVTPAVGKSEANWNTKLNPTNTLYLVEVFLDHSLLGNSVLVMVSTCVRTAFYRYVLDILSYL